ncbi:hydroxylysine kinase-like [Haemaphysalis longicornis]
MHTDTAVMSVITCRRRSAQVVYYNCPCHNKAMDSDYSDGDMLLYQGSLPLSREDPQLSSYPHGFVLKVTNWIESQETEFLESISHLLTEVSKSVVCQQPLQSKEGRFFITELFPIGGPHSSMVKECAVRLFAFVPGCTLDRRSLTDKICVTWGALLGRLHRTLEGADKYPALLNRYNAWSLWSVPELVPLVDVVVENTEDRRIVREVIAQYAQLEHELSSLPVGVLHGDLNEKNVLTCPHVKEGSAEDEGDQAGDEVYAVLDWGGVYGGPRVLDLAVLLAYVLIAPTGSRSAEENVGLALSAYLGHVPEEREHVPLLRTLIAARLCQSLVKGLQAYQQHPGNTYVLDTQKSGWHGLRRLWNMPNDELMAVWNRVLGETTLPSADT